MFLSAVYRLLIIAYHYSWIQGGNTNACLSWRASRSIQQRSSYRPAADRHCTAQPRLYLLPDHFRPTILNHVISLGFGNRRVQVAAHSIPRARILVRAHRTPAGLVRLDNDARAMSDYGGRQGAPGAMNGQEAHAGMNRPIA